jgi:hypothetical protein
MVLVRKSADFQKGQQGDFIFWLVFDYLLEEVCGFGDVLA